MRVRALVVLVSVFGLAGCFTPQRIRPGAEHWSRGVRNVGVLSAIRIVELLPGDVEELHEDWTAQGEKNVVTALSDGLRARGFKPKLMSWKGDDELDEVRLLYAEVAEAVWRYTYPPFEFPFKEQRFEYGVGSIQRILDRAGADILIVAAGKDQFGSDGQKFSVFSGARSWSLLTLGLVARNGDVIWFDLWGGRSIDLRNLDDVRASVEKMLNELPGAVP